MLNSITGRKWNRSKALEFRKTKDKKGNSFTVQKKKEFMFLNSISKMLDFFFKVTELGSYVIAEDKDLLYEEMPEAYKEIKDIIADLENAKMIKVIAIFRPLITYKMRVRRYDN